MDLSRFDARDLGYAADAIKPFEDLIPTVTDQNPCAQSRSPMDMMRQGCATSLFQASQQ